MTRRKKRDLSGALMIDGFPMRWSLKSEQIWSPDGAHTGLRLSIERSDEAHRELVLEYPFREMPGGKIERPDIKADALESDIRRAMDAGWKPKSRGRPFFFAV
jgi:hypothetical protein